MIRINPITVTGGTLTSTNVYETAPAVYNAGTTYGDGDFRHVVNGQNLDIYESLQAANTGNTPSSSPTWWRFRSYTHAEYNAGTTYGLGNLIIVAASHRVYESLQAGNTGHTPADAASAAWWLDIGATNPWIAMDAKIQSVTERTGSIQYVITPAEIVERLVFFNVSGSSIDISISDPTDGVVFTENIPIISTSNVFDGYSYFFAPFLTQENSISADTPPYVSAVYTITINGGADTDTVSVGEIVMGPKDFVGNTMYSPTIEILDFSTKERNDFGDFTVVERAYSKRVGVDMYIENAIVEYMLQGLNEYRSTPVVWVPTEGTDLDSAFLVYGFYFDFKLTARYPQYSLISLTFESLT